MNIIIAVVIGVLIGWGASVLKGTDGREDLIRNVAVAIAGAYVGGWLLGKLFESANAGGFSFTAMFASTVGAAALLFLVSRLKQA